MVTASKIRCVVLVADAESDRMAQRTQPRFRPSDLLPWADPHIRSLVEQLQDEVRQEEAARRDDERAKLDNLKEWVPAERDSLFASPGARRF